MPLDIALGTSASMGTGSGKGSALTFAVPAGSSVAIQTVLLTGVTVVAEGLGENETTNDAAANIMAIAAIVKTALVEVIAAECVDKSRIYARRTQINRIEYLNKCNQLTI